MKKEELNFKIVVGELEEHIKGIYAAMKQDPYGNFASSFLLVEKGEIEAHSIGYSDLFFKSNLPEVSYPQAIELIAQVEEPKKQGEWVEFEVDEKGNYRPGNGQGLFNWQDNYVGSKFIFGGWLWEHKNAEDLWSCNRAGKDENDNRTFYAGLMAKPCVPVKIRFWRVKGGE